ncbi:MULTISPECIES: hypothetical protein [unclassified Streptomyces]|uniref:hypothetical protein n=1 Tax=unclassified Streptomyces TaxID=2593676 RepID=UPI00363A1787
MDVIDISRTVEKALNSTRDHRGRITDHQAAATALADRNRAALHTYREHLAPHADSLLAAARQGLDRLPPARHTTAWRDLLDGLASSHAEITRTLSRTSVPGSPDEHEHQGTAWQHLAFWAEHSHIADTLAAPTGRGVPELTGEAQQRWTERAQAAQLRGGLELAESWYAADGRPITLAHLVEDDESTLVALRGDPSAPNWQVIGHYAHEYMAGQVLPERVPPGVLRPDVSRYDRPEPAPEISLQDLLRDVIEARCAGDASDALLTATQHGYNAGPAIRLSELLATCAQFAAALDTVQGRQVATRLSALGRQLDFLNREVQDAAEELGATVAVLPPHRTPRPQGRPRPAVNAAPPGARPRAVTPARHR